MTAEIGTAPADDPADDPSVADDGLFAPEHRRLTAGILLLLATNAFEIIGSATAMPAVLEDLGGRGQYGWAIAAPTVGSVLGASLGGRLADRLGSRRALHIGLALFVAGILAISAGSSMTMVAAGRLGMGVGSGICFTLELVLIARYLPAHLAPTAIAASATVFVIPGLVGPTIVGAIVTAFGWQWVFLGILPVVLVCLALLEPELRRRKAVDDPTVAPPAPVELPSGGSAAVASILQRPWWGPILLASGLAVGVIAASTSGWPAVLVSVGALVAVAAGSRASLPEGTFTARPGLPAAVGCTLLACLGYLTAEAYFPLLLRDLRGQPLWVAGMPLTVAAVFWTGGAWLQARVPARMRRRATTGGALATCVGLLLVAIAVDPSIPAAAIYVGTALASFGCGFVVSLSQQIALEQAPPGDEGATAASVQLATLLGIALGTSVVGVLVARIDDLGLVIAMTMTGAALAGALVMIPARRLPIRGPSTPSE